jgi:hypothetical protein
MSNDDLYFCPCCGTPWPTEAEMESCHWRCLAERQAKLGAPENNPISHSEIKPGHEPRKS